MAQEPPASNFIFASLSVILLSMFVFLNSLATKSLPKESQAMLSVRQALDARQDWQKNLLQNLAPTLRSQITPLGGTVKEDEDKLLVLLDSNRLFEGEQRQISAKALVSLKDFSTSIVSGNLKLDISYRTTPAGLAANWEQQWDLALDRASALQRFFVDDSETKNLVTAAATGADPANQFRVLLTLTNRESIRDTKRDTKRDNG